MSHQSSNSLTHLIGGQQDTANKPVGIKLFGACFNFKSESSKRAYHQGLVLLMTFIAYAAFHMGRRPLSVVKNVLNRDCSKLPKINSGPSGQVAGADNTYITIASNDSVYPGNSEPSGGETSVTPLDDYDGTWIQDTSSNSTGADMYRNFFASTQRPSSSVQTLAADNGHAAGGGVNQSATTIVVAKDTSCDWAPFDNDDTANELLAYLDTSFLLSYAIFMFVSGFVAERTNLRYFIVLGSIFSGLGLIGFGLSKPLELHSMGYFVMIQILSGAFQTTGWPVVVTCVSNWFDRSRLGTIYGLWNSHTNLGNILGATIAGYYVETDWALSFIVPGVIMIMVGVLLFMFLVPSPQDVGLASLIELEALDGGEAQNGHGDEQVATMKTKQSSERAAAADGATSGPPAQSSQHLQRPHSRPQSGPGKLAGGLIDAPQSQKGLDVQPAVSSSSRGSNSGQPSGEEETVGSGEGSEPSGGGNIAASGGQHAKAISFMKALKIPGVIEYSLCLFFSKLVSYTFLYWLPRYIVHSTTFNSTDSAYLSTPFDVGGILGSIMAGWLSDRFKVNGIICNIMLLLAIPSMFIYQQFGANSSMHNILLQLLVGSLVNGPYCLITTAVSADLGNRIKDGRAMATVSAIIDGMGSMGAVLGPLFAGFVSKDWRLVFMMLMMADVFASLCIVRVTVQDVRSKLLKKHRPTTSADQLGPPA